MNTGIQQDVEAVAERAVSSTQLTLQTVEVLTITSADEYQQAGAMLREIVTRAKDIDDERKAILRPLDETRKRVMDLFRPALENLAEAERRLKGSISIWAAVEQERIRQEEARLAEIARKEAEKLAAKAQKAIESGHYEKAAALETAADNVTVQEVAAPAKAAGISTRENWSAKVVDKVALIQAVAEGKVEQGAIEVNLVYLNRIAKALRGDMAKRYPGVEAVSETTVVAQSGIQSTRSMPRRV